jgi:hypothetical protein
MKIQPKNEIPTKLQRELFDTAGSLGDMAMY